MFRNAISDNISDDIKLESDARQMMAGLEQMSNLVSYSMTMADNKYKELALKVQNYQSLQAQAQKFLEQGKEEMARRCVALKQQAATDIETLKSDYVTLQQDAEDKVARFKSEKRKVDTRLRELPRLKQDVKLIQQQKEIDKTFSTLSLESPSSSFDEIAGEIGMKKGQLQNKRLLEGDPTAAIDNAIVNQLQEDNINQEMARLRQKINAPTIEDAEYTEVNDPNLGEALNLLEKPRFGNIPDTNIRGANVHNEQKKEE
ncbi:MAG: hypothetical protein NUV82_01725 [Candidatus Komeilibacteria bacterium]|nr:hypothetical protein [Candidatus Komeilibacteria bacterium]